MPSRVAGASARHSTTPSSGCGCSRATTTRSRPRDGVRTFAIVAIVAMVAVWIVLPGVLALALAT